MKRTKTGEERSVDLSGHLAGVLSFLIERRAAAQTKVVPITGALPTSDDARTLSPWLFYPELGEKPTRKDAQRVYKNALRAMRRSLEAAGLPTHHGLHALRHTYGSGLVSRGVPPPTCRRRWDIASIQQTADTYGSWFPPRVPWAVDALAETLAGGRGHCMDTAGGMGASGVS